MILSQDFIFWESRWLALFPNFKPEKRKTNEDIIQNLCGNKKYGENAETK